MNQEESERPDALVWLRWNVAHRHAEQSEASPYFAEQKCWDPSLEPLGPVQIRSLGEARTGSAAVIPAALTTLAMQDGAAKLFCGPGLPSLLSPPATPLVI